MLTFKKLIKMELNDSILSKNLSDLELYDLYEKSSVFLTHRTKFNLSLDPDIPAYKKEKVGIYFLISLGCVVYVGQACPIGMRVKNHIKDKKIFDTVRVLTVPHVTRQGFGYFNKVFYPLSKEDFSKLEKQFIQLFLPFFNKKDKDKNNKTGFNSLPKSYKENYLSMFDI